MAPRALWASALAVLLVGLTARADDKALAADLKKFDGTWEVLSALVNGEEMTPEQRSAFRLVVKGGTYEKRVDGKPTEKGKVAFVGQENKVIFLDLTPADGPNKGKTFKGLFEWIGDDAARVSLPVKPLAGRLVKVGGEKGTGQGLTLYKRAAE